MPTKLAEAFVEITTRMDQFDSGLNHVKKELEHLHKEGGHNGAVETGFWVEAFHLLGEGIHIAFERVHQFIDAIIEANSHMEVLQTRFAGFMGSAEEAAKRMERLANWNEGKPFAIQDVVEANLSLFKMGGAALAAVSNMNMLGDAAAQTGMSITAVAHEVGRFYQMLQSGFVDRIQFFLRHMQMMGIVTPKAAAEIKKMSKEGKSATEIWAAFKTAMGREGVAGATERMATTFEGMTTILHNAFHEAMKTIGKPFFDLVKEGMGKAIQFIKGDEWKTAIAGITDSFTDMSSAIMDAFGQIKFSDVVDGIRAVFDGIAVVVRNFKLYFELVWVDLELAVWRAMDGMVNALSGGFFADASDLIGEMIGNFIGGWHAISAAAETLWSQLKAGFQELVNIIGALFDGIKAAWDSYVKHFMEQFDRIKDVLKGKLSVQDFFKGAANGMEDVFTKGIDAAMAKFANQKNADFKPWDFGQIDKDAKAAADAFKKGFKADGGVTGELERRQQELLDQIGEKEEEARQKRLKDQKEQMEDEEEAPDEFKNKEVKPSFIGIAELSKKIQESVAGPKDPQEKIAKNTEDMNKGIQTHVAWIQKGAPVKVEQTLVAVLE